MENAIKSIKREFPRACSDELHHSDNCHVRNKNNYKTDVFFIAKLRLFTLIAIPMYPLHILILEQT